MKASDENFKAVDTLNRLLCLVSNPHIHLLRYAEGETPTEIVLKQFSDEVECAEAAEVIKKKIQDALDGKLEDENEN